MPNLAGLPLWFVAAVALLSVLGFAGLLQIIANRLFARFDARSKKREEADTVEIQDAAAMRGELWQQLQVATERNTALAERYGVAIQDRAIAIGEKESAMRQLSDLLGRYATVAQKLEVADTLRDQDRKRFETRIAELTKDRDERERERDVLARRNFELEQSLVKATARATRSSPSQRTDAQRQAVHTDHLKETTVRLPSVDEAPKPVPTLDISEEAPDGS
jgi:hypothetical protein